MSAEARGRARELRAITMGCCVVALAAEACATTPPPRDAPPPSTTTTAPRHDVRPVAPLAPPTKPLADPRPTLPTEEVRFTEAVRCSVDEITLFPLGPEWLGLCGGGYEHASFGAANAGSAFSIRADGAVRPEPGLFSGRLPPVFTVRGAWGRSLDDLDIALARPDIRGELLSWFTRTKSGFKAAAPRSSTLWPLNYGVPPRAWIAGHELVGGQSEGAFHYIDGHRGWLPRAARGSTPGCETRVSHRALAVDDEGALWAIGWLCEGGVGVERFEVGKPGSTVEVLVSKSEIAEGDVGLTFVGGGLFAHSRGKTGAVLRRRTKSGWEPIDTTGIAGLDVLPSAAGGDVLVHTGSLLRIEGAKLIPVADDVEQVVVATDGAVWMRAKDGILRWRDRKLVRVSVSVDGAAPPPVVELATNAKGGALLVVKSPTSPGSVLLEETRTRNPASAQRLALDGEATLGSPFRSFYPLGASGDCSDDLGMGDGRSWVLLYRLSRTAPADYDYPATRAALRGQQAFAGVELVEVENLGERHFVGITATGDQARALVHRIRTTVRGSAPQAFCRVLQYPNMLPPVRVLRELSFDVGTGELTPTKPRPDAP